MDKSDIRKQEKHLRVYCFGKTLEKDEYLLPNSTKYVFDLVDFPTSFLSINVVRLSNKERSKYYLHKGQKTMIKNPSNEIF